MGCEPQRKYIWLFIFFAVTLIPAIVVLAFTRMPTNVDMLTEENARFEVSGNADFLIFWGVLFFTCVVGIIELLQLMERKDKKMMKSLYSLMHWGLLFGIISSLSRSWDLMRENYEIMTSGKLGPDYKRYILGNWSIFDLELIRSIWFEALLIIGSIVILDLIFCGRTGLLSEHFLDFSFGRRKVRSEQQEGSY